MSDFILEYDVLEAIAKSSTSLGKQANDYGESLESKIISGIESVTGPSSGYLISASDVVRDKINALKLKSEAFYSFANQISNLLEVAEQMDQEVADAIAVQRKYFLDHHESLRIEDWRAELLNLFIEIKNSIPLLGLIADILDGLKTIFDSLEDAVKHWYECEGGKYIIKAIGSVIVALAAIALFVIAIPASGFFAICGAIGAGIALINAGTNVATSFRAADAAMDGNPAWAMIYGKQDKLSDVLRQKNFGSSGLNHLSNLGAGALDTTETFCDIIGLAEIGVGIAKLFKGDTFKLLKGGKLKFSDLKSSVKNGIVDLKNSIKNGYADLKNGSKSVEIVTEGSGQANRKIVDTKGARNDLPLTKEQYDELVSYAKDFGFPEENIALFNPDSPFETGLAYGDRLYINNDALPSSIANGNPNSLVSGKGAMAHEIVGHYETVQKGTAFKTQYYDSKGAVKIDLYNLALDEAQASIRAGRFAPGLTNSERLTLIKDGMTRLKNQGIKIKDVRGLLDILER